MKHSNLNGLMTSVFFRLGKSPNILLDWERAAVGIPKSQRHKISFRLRDPRKLEFHATLHLPMTLQLYNKSNHILSAFRGLETISKKMPPSPLMQLIPNKIVIPDQRDGFPSSAAHFPTSPFEHGKSYFPPAVSSHCEENCTWYQL